MAVASAFESMFPFQPPLPTASNLPFQFAVAGIHTSIFMSDSVVGFSVAAIRQNAGRSAYCAPPPRPPPPAGVNAPAATLCADPIVALGNFRSARLSQVAAIAGAVIKTKTSKTAEDKINLFMCGHLDVRGKKSQKARAAQEKY